MKYQTQNNYKLATTIKLNNENANARLTRAKENLENQAKKMMAWSDKKLLPVAVHSTVRVPVPAVDKGRLNARSIIVTIVLEVINKFKNYMFNIDK